jgi:outer membrane protein assembly factor BamD (BamD/ComL family)
MRTHTHFIILISTIALFSNQFATTALMTETEYYERIRELAHSHKNRELYIDSKKFFRNYPKSKYIPEIKLMLAENEQDPDRAIQMYRILVDNYRYYVKRDYAQYRLCEILYLTSKWNALRRESLKALKLFKKSDYLIHFELFLAKANIFLDRLYEARKTCQHITRTNHDYNNLSKAILLISHIDKNTSGYSKNYIKELREIIVGFQNSDITPAVIYLLGQYYEKKRDYDRSYSAYVDLVKKFPKSPESAYARRRISRLEKNNPRLINYIPDDKTIENIEMIDIHPEIDIDNGEGLRKGILYAISLGPFYNLKSTEEIAQLIKNDFKPISIVRLRRSFAIYVGRFKKSESALSVKIRLAEEFGLNGNIVRIRKNYNKQYLYGE